MDTEESELQAVTVEASHEKDGGSAGSEEACLTSLIQSESSKEMKMRKCRTQQMTDVRDDDGTDDRDGNSLPLCSFLCNAFVGVDDVSCEKDKAALLGGGSKDDRDCFKEAEQSELSQLGQDIAEKARRDAILTHGRLLQPVLSELKCKHPMILAEILAEKRKKEEQKTDAKALEEEETQPSSSAGSGQARGASSSQGIRQQILQRFGAFILVIRAIVQCGKCKRKEGTATTKTPQSSKNKIKEGAATTKLRAKGIVQRSKSKLKQGKEASKARENGVISTDNEGTTHVRSEETEGHEKEGKAPAKEETTKYVTKDHEETATKLTRQASNVTLTELTRQASNVALEVYNTSVDSLADNIMSLAVSKERIEKVYNTSVDSLADSIMSLKVSIEGIEQASEEVSKEEAVETQINPAKGIDESVEYEVHGEVIEMHT